MDAFCLSETVATFQAYVASRPLGTFTPKSRSVGATTKPEACPGARHVQEARYATTTSRVTVAAVSLTSNSVNFPSITAKFGGFILVDAFKAVSVSYSAGAPAPAPLLKESVAVSGLTEEIASIPD